MAGMILVTAACIAVMLALVWKMHVLRRDIYSFSDHLEQCLDAMISGEPIETFADMEDSLWGKIYVRLQRLDKIWQRQNHANIEEKKQIKELISDISHQTKTPVANMKIYLEILENEDMDAADRKEFLQKLGKQTEKLDFLFQSMVKMSRLETGIIEIRRQQLPVYETLGGAVAAIVPKAEKKHIRLSVDCGEEISVSHDRKWTEEAVFNILDNAVKYTPDGGTIRIAVAVQEFFTKISIRDSGKGIVPERHAEIFQRFYREPEVHDEEGIGVGLYLARKIVTLQKGYIEVRSEAGRGAEFLVYLPNN